MLSTRLIQHTSRISRPTLNTILRAKYHSLHEDTASVLPNNVETASASFKVCKKKKLSEKCISILIYNV